MHRGYVKFWRKIIDWEWYSDANTWRLFSHLLLKANYKDKPWRGIIIKRGEYLTSQRKLVGETGLSRQNVRTALDNLKITKDITSRTTRDYTIITLCNFEKYNNSENENNQRSNQQANQLTNQQLTITKKEKNIKNIKKEINKEKKHKHGKYKHVLLTDEQYKELIKDWGESKTKNMIKILDEEIQMKPARYRYNDHNLALRKWEKNQWKWKKDQWPIPNRRIKDECPQEREKIPMMFEEDL